MNVKPLNPTTAILGECLIKGRKGTPSIFRVQIGEIEFGVKKIFRHAPNIYSLRSMKESLSNAELGMGNAELKRI